MTSRRMELNHVRIEKTPPSSGRSTPNRLNRDTSTSNRKMISLRKYTPAICILEALAIISFIIYIYIYTPNYNPLPINSPNKRNDIYRNFSNEIVLVPELIEGCTMRKYDIKHGVKCQSKDIDRLDCKLPGIPVDSGEPLNLQRPYMVVSSMTGARFDTRPIEAATYRPCDSDCLGKTRLIINPQIKYQSIIGWGGALTDSSINVILSLTTNGTKQLLDDYFGEDGLKYNMIRITIGGSDFSSRLYSNDDTNYDDIYLKDFKLMEEDKLYKIPMLRYIQSEYGHHSLKSRGGLKLFASMWSPPLWMKTNNHFNKGYLKGSFNYFNRDKRYFAALAHLKKKFLLSYQSEAISFWGLTVMNEPLWAIQPFIDFNTMIFPIEDYKYYVAEHLGPAIKDDPRLGHIKIMAHDDNRRYLLNYTFPILENRSVLQYVDGISTHGYVDEEYQLMDIIANKYRRKIPGFFVLPTELSSGHLPFMEKALVGNWQRGIHYGLDIIHGLQHSAAGWVDWNMALDTTGGPNWLGGRLDSPMIVDKEKDLYYKNPMFYAIGHFSRYIPPDSVRVDTTILHGQYDYQFEAVTFILPNRQNLTTVILNNNPYPIEVYLELEWELPMHKYQRIVSEAGSITTIVYPIGEVVPSIGY